MVITIGRSCGSGGLEIAQKLALRLGVCCYDADTLLAEAEAAGCAEKMRAFLAESRSTACSTRLRSRTTRAAWAGFRLRSCTRLPRARILFCSGTAATMPCATVPILTTLVYSW